MSKQPVNGGLSEHSIQSAIVQWAWLQAPSIIGLAALFAVPNGARVAPSVANRLKREGMRAGVSDLVLPLPAAGRGSLYLETKTEIGRVSPDQRAWHDALRAIGHRVEVCRSIESGISILREHALSWEAEATQESCASMRRLWVQFQAAGSRSKRSVR